MDKSVMKAHLWTLYSFAAAVVDEFKDESSPSDAVLYNLVKHHLGGLRKTVAAFEESKTTCKCQGFKVDPKCVMKH